MESLQKIVPWLIALPWIAKILVSAIVILFALFLIVLIWIPQESGPTPTEREVAHRISWIHAHLDDDPLLVKSAYEVLNSITGNGGYFRPSSQEFNDIPLSTLVSVTKSYKNQERPVRELETQLQKRLPGVIVPGAILDSILTNELRKTAESIKLK